MKPTAQIIDGRSMRTLADALAKLEEAGWLKEGDHATVRAFWMQLPDGTMVATVAVMAPGEQPYYVVLPAAVRFTANNTVGERPEHHLDELDGAITDRHGNVQLPNGSYVHAIELIPVHLPSESEAEKEASLRPRRPWLEEGVLSPASRRAPATGASARLRLGRAGRCRTQVAELEVHRA